MPIICTPSEACLRRRSRQCMSCMQVVDEADRLLRQAYNEWLPVLNNALAKNGNDVSMHQGASDGALRGQFAAFARSTPSTKRLVKVLVSATLTKDPTKLAKMNLLFPRCVHLVLAYNLCCLQPLNHWVSRKWWNYSFRANKCIQHTQETGREHPKASK